MEDKAPLFLTLLDQKYIFRKGVFLYCPTRQLHFSEGGGAASMFFR